MKTKSWRSLSSSNNNNNNAISPTTATEEEVRALCFPLKHCLNSHAAFHHPNEKVKTIFRKAFLDQEASERDVTVSFILLEKCRGEQSPWNSYLDALPTNAHKQGAPGWDENSNASTIIKGTTLDAAAKAERNNRKHEWARMHAVIVRAAEACGEPETAQHAHTLTVDDWAWAKANFWGRAMALPWGATTAVESVVPGVDCANHRIPPNARWEVCKGSSGDQDAHVCLLVNREMAKKLPPDADTELFVDYGTKTSEELLFHHGFVDAPEDGWPSKRTWYGLLGPSTAKLDKAAKPTANDAAVLVLSTIQTDAGDQQELAERVATVRARMLACFGPPRLICRADLIEGRVVVDDDTIATANGAAFEEALERRLGWSVEDLARLSVAAVHGRRLAEVLEHPAWERMLAGEAEEGDLAVVSRAICADAYARADGLALLRALLGLRARSLLGVAVDEGNVVVEGGDDAGLIARLRASAREDIARAAGLSEDDKARHALTYRARQKRIVASWLAMVSRLETKAMDYAMMMAQ